MTLAVVLSYRAKPAVGMHEEAQKLKDHVEPRANPDYVSVLAGLKPRECIPFFLTGDITS